MKAKPFSTRVKIRLGTLGAIRTEMCRCYRAACKGELPWTDFTRALCGLKIIADLDAGAAFDARLGEIERRLAGAPVRSNGYDRPGEVLHP